VPQKPVAGSARETSTSNTADDSVKSNSSTRVLCSGGSFSMCASDVGDYPLAKCHCRIALHLLGDSDAFSFSRAGCR